MNMYHPAGIPADLVAWSRDATRWQRFLRWIGWTKPPRRYTPTEAAMLASHIVNATQGRR